MVRYLTPKRKRILKLIDEGLCTKEIADQTGTSQRTVETNCYKMNKDFGVHSIFEVLQKAKKKNLL